MTEYIPIYINDTLYFGSEPDGTSADGGMTPQEPTEPTEPDTAPETTEPTTSGSDINWGDANCDNNVDINDSVLIMSHLANKAKYPLTAEAVANGDVYQNGDGISIGDANSIQKYLAKMIPSLPES